jgi:hypothetical protein
MSKTYPIFPELIIEGELSLDINITKKIRAGVLDAKNSGSATKTNFGWMTDKGLPQEEAIKNLQLLLGNMFVDEIDKALNGNVKKQVEVNIIEPNVIAVAPGHIYPVNVDRDRWYNCILWLQTTNKGSMLYQENFGAKLQSTPPLLQPHTNYIKSKLFRYAFFPAHIPWGLSPNQSAVETIVLNQSFVTKPKINK